MSKKAKKPKERQRQPKRIYVHRSWSSDEGSIDGSFMKVFAHKGDAIRSAAREMEDLFVYDLVSGPHKAVVREVAELDGEVV